MSLEWECSSRPPPLEYWAYDSITWELPKGTHHVFIRRGFRMKWSIVRYDSEINSTRTNYKVLAGPFDDLETAKVTWRLLFSI